MPDPATRTALVAIVVLSAHAVMVWLLFTGDAVRPAPIVVPVDMHIKALVPPSDESASPTRAPTEPTRMTQDIPSGRARPAERTQTASPAEPASAPMPQAQIESRPHPAATEPQTNAPEAPVAQDSAAVVPLPATPSPGATRGSSNAAPPPPPAPPAPPRIQLPSSQADHLHNPKPAYPPLSKRLGEQGRVVVRVRIEADGTASLAEIHTSSGYDRLDQAARQTVLRWRYVPAQRDGVPEAMWFNVPIQFILE